MVDAVGAMREFAAQIGLHCFVDGLLFGENRLNACRCKSVVSRLSHSAREQDLAIHNHLRHAAGVCVATGAMIHVLCAMLMRWFGALFTRNDFAIFNRYDLVLGRLPEM